MSIASSHEVFDWAISTKKALVAFNVTTLETAEAIIEGAAESCVPVIAQLSENAIRFHGRPDAIARAMVEVASHSPQPVVLHLDHITDETLAKRTIDLGFSSVMWDSSSLSYEDNVRATQEIVAWAAGHGVWVESEIGEIGGKDGAHAPGASTKPEEASRFVADTGIDAVAVAVGSSHAMTSQTAELDLERIEAIAAATAAPLVLHGSSGVPDDSLRHARDAGIVKINIGTALSQAFTGRIRRELEAHPHLVDPRQFLVPARAHTAELVRRYLDLLST